MAERNNCRRQCISTGRTSSCLSTPVGTKGADSIVKARLDPHGNKYDLDDELNRFARIGLRTLLVAMKIVSED